MAIRLIAIDIDGTLLDSHGDLPSANRNAVRNCLDSGVSIVLVTGRSYHHARPVGAALSKQIPLIVSNGALMKRANGQTLRRQVLDIAITREIIMLSRNHHKGAAVIFDREGPRQYLYEEIDWKHPNRRHYYKINQQFMSQHAPLEDALNESPIQLSFTGGVQKIRQLSEFVQSLNISDKISITLTEYEDRDFSLLDITTQGCSKGSMLKYWCQNTGVNTDDVMAIGDNLNDRAMLELVGHPVVMGNAVPELKKNGWPTTASHDDGGLAQAIRDVLAVDL